MPATLATVQKAVIHLLNANTTSSYTISVTDDRYHSGLIDEAIFESDESVVLCIAETPGHWARASYLVVSSALTHGDEIPTHIGNIGQVLIDGVPGVHAPYEAIIRYRENAENSYGSVAHTVAPLAGYYAITEEDVIYFTGSSATVRLFNYTRTAVLQSPEVYTGAVVAGALATLIKEGGALDRAVYFGQLFGNYLQMIKANAKSIPVLAQAA